MTTFPPVALTATTETIRDVLRTRANVSYSAAARAAGLRPYILPVLDASDADSMLDGMAGLILTGGEDVDPAHYGGAPHPALGDVHPPRDAFELALVRAARARRLPTLAICRGVQVANVALGGTLVQDLPSEWPTALAHDGSWGRGDRLELHGLLIRIGNLIQAIGKNYNDDALYMTYEMNKVKMSSDPQLKEYAKDNYHFCDEKLFSEMHGYLTDNEKIINDFLKKHSQN